MPPKIIVVMVAIILMAIYYPQVICVATSAKFKLLSHTYLVGSGLSGNVPELTKKKQHKILVPI